MHLMCHFQIKDENPAKFFQCFHPRKVLYKGMSPASLAAARVRLAPARAGFAGAASSSVLYSALPQVNA